MARLVVWAGALVIWASAGIGHSQQCTGKGQDREDAHYDRLRTAREWDGRGCLTLKEGIFLTLYRNQPASIVPGVRPAI